MHNFKRIIVLLVVLIGMEFLVDFLLEPVTYTNYLQYDLKQLKKAGMQPDVVFAGDSRIYRSFVPEIFDCEFGNGQHCSINIGSGSQRIKGTYYCLKDMLEKYPIKYAVVGLTYTNFQKEKTSSVQADLLIWDRLQTTSVRLEYIKEVFPVKQWPYLLKSYRYRGNFDGISENLKAKLSKETRQGIDTRTGEHYENRGYVWSESAYRDGEVGMPSPEPAQWLEDEVEEEAFVWLDKIRELCERQDVQLILVTGPTTLSTIYAVKDYQKSYQAFDHYASLCNLPYFELNLLKGRRKLLPDSMMRDSDHVSGAGAERITSILCQILNDYLEGKDTDRYFYVSVEEMKEDINEVIACDFYTEEISGSEDRLWIAESLQQEESIVEYEFLISDETDEGRWEVLRSYSEQQQCVIPGERLREPVRMRVNARIKGSGKEWEAYMAKEREPEG